MKRPEQRLRQSQTRGFNNNVIRWRRLRQQRLDRRQKIISNRTADAAIGQLDDIFLSTVRAAASSKDITINTDITKLIDDQRQTAPVSFLNEAAISVVLPAPRKPVMTVAGMRVASMMSIPSLAHI